MRGGATRIGRPGRTELNDPRTRTCSARSARSACSARSDRFDRPARPRGVSRAQSSRRAQNRSTSRAWNARPSSPGSIEIVPPPQSTVPTMSWYSECRW
jgi:hypothetical protein